MKARQKRFMFIAIGIAAVGLAVGLVLNALKDNVSLYFTPTQVFNGEAPHGRSFRIGGMVKEGSVIRVDDALTSTFEITDSHRSIPVSYKGILPDLFKEGKGVVAQGRVEADGVMYADEVLAKHDENYMPPEAADAMEQAKELRAKEANAMGSMTKPAITPIAK